MNKIVGVITSTYSMYGDDVVLTLRAVVSAPQEGRCERERERERYLNRN